MSNRKAELEYINDKIRVLQDTIKTYGKTYGKTANAELNMAWGMKMCYLVIEFRKLNASPIKKSDVN